MNSKEMSAIDYMKRGNTRVRDGDYNGAIDDFTEVIAKMPYSASAHNNRGGAKLCIHDYDGAIADLEKAIELDPKLKAAYQNLEIAKDLKGLKTLN